jgi:hypothetical protein
MGLNVSNTQIAKELELNKDDVQRMTGQLRAGVVERQQPTVLEGTVECDEVSIVAGHKGHPSAVKKRRNGRHAASKAPAAVGRSRRRSRPSLGCSNAAVPS